MFMIFYTVKIVYICVFMTGFTSHYLCDTCNGSMECVFIYICVHVSVVISLYLLTVSEELSEIATEVNNVVRVMQKNSRIAVGVGLL